MQKPLDRNRQIEKVITEDEAYDVLIVGDKANDIKIVNSLLREMGLGKKTYSAPNGKALQLAEKLQPDLILVDWHMPEMDGLEFVKAIKTSSITCGIPCIMLTAAKTDPASMKAGFDAGVHDYLRKPFDKLEFFARVGATLKLQKAYLDLQKNREEIINQAHLISEQHAELQKVNHLKDNILLAISHDLRSPLATLDSILGVFHDKRIELKTEELMEYTSMIHENVRHVLSFMDSLLFWSKTQFYEAEVSKSTFDLSKMADEITQLFTKKVTLKEIQLINKISAETIIHCNQNIISFILRNLVDNAIKFTPKAGKIKINFNQYPTHGEISVSDTGEGMDTSAINDFFADNSMTSTFGTFGEIGTGIGLKLCKDFAKEIGATLTVESEEGKGSTFKLRCLQV